jgi:hypothetical protein
MKDLKRILMSCIVSLFLLTLIIVFPGCSKHNPMEPTLTVDQEAYISGKGDKGDKKAKTQYPQSGAIKLKYDKKSESYSGGKLKTPNGSSFVVDKKALTPPGDLLGKSVTIEMIIEKTSNDELQFSFEPSGCKFGPTATIIIDYAEFTGDKKVKWDHKDNSSDIVLGLFEIGDNDDHIPLDPSFIDGKNKKVYISIPHFSRYSLIKR